jgi:beta-lactamase superfamily II metal-dependent hydrolase
MTMETKYINVFKTKLVDKKGKKLRYMIWGDTVLLTGNKHHDNVNYLEAWGREALGYIRESELTVNPLLEIYVIDVGQGDGVLFKTPDGKWHLMDAGIKNSWQMTKKGAANFIRWKFIDELKKPAISLENLILSHPDFDHYGGMIDLLSGDVGREGIKVVIKNFYHSGMGRFADDPKLGNTVKGKVSPFPRGYHGIQHRGTFITQLLNNKFDFSHPPRSFSESFDELAKLIDSKVPNVKRLDQSMVYFPDYAPGDHVDYFIEVLGPVVEKTENGQLGLRYLESSESKTRNGHSVILKIKYKRAEILLTGDLNESSQKLLMSYFFPDRFRCDVAKGCHHGSEDIDLNFIKAMAAKATVISSGDNEDYSHPRPIILGASGKYGTNYLDASGNLNPPLVYSTELARSTKLDHATRVRSKEDNKKRYYPPAHVDVKTESEREYFDLERTPINTDLIYGLVNIRTDGEKIFIATMEEKGGDFDYKVIYLQ